MCVLLCVNPGTSVSLHNPAKWACFLNASYCGLILIPLFKCEIFFTSEDAVEDLSHKNRGIDSFMCLLYFKPTSKAVFQPVLWVNKFSQACTNTHRVQGNSGVNMNHLEKFLSKQSWKLSPQEKLTKVECYLFVVVCILGRGREVGWIRQSDLSLKISF